MADREGTLIRLNQTLRDTLHVTDEDLVGKYNIFKDAQVEEQGLMPLVRRVWDRGETVRFTMHYNGAALQKGEEKQPTDLVLDVTISPILDSRGKLTHAIIQHFDVTERIRTEEALRRKTEEIDRFFATSLDLLCVCDSAGRLVRINPQWEKVLGYPLSHLHNRTIVDLIHPDDLQASREKLSLSLTRETTGFVNRYRCKDGSYRWLEWNSYPSGGLIYAMARDITERRRAEETIRRSELLIRAVIESVDDGMLVVARSGAILLYNSRFVQLWSVPMEMTALPDDVPLLNCAAQQTLDPEAFVARVMEIYSGDATINDIVNFRDGRVIERFSTRIDIPGMEGARMWRFRDITARLRAEDALRDREARWSSIFNASPVGIGLAANRVVLEVNDALCQISGYSREELLGNSTRIHYPSDAEFAAAGDLYRQIAVHGTGNIEARWRHKDGSIRLVYLYAAPLDPKHVDRGVSFIVLDITERKRADEALKASQALLSDSQRIAHIGSWELDLKTGQLVWTDECFRIYGQDPHRFTPNIDSLTALVLPEDRGILKVQMEASLRTRTHPPFQYRIVRPDGEVRWIYVTGDIVSDAAGTLIKFRGTQQDVTERTLAENALRDREARLASIFRAAPVTIGVITNRIIGDFNETLSRVTGYSPEELEGKPTRFLYPSDEEAKAATEIYRMLEKQDTASIESRWKRKDGEIINILLTGAPLVRGDFSRGITFIGMDITARKKAEAALRSNERKLAEIFRASPEFISVSTFAEGLMLEINDAGLALLRFSREEVIGREAVEIGIWPTAVERQRVIEALRAQGQLRGFEARMQKKTGEPVAVLLSMVPIVVEGRNCILTVATDMTERQQAEEKRLALERQLLHAQKLESLGVLAGGIAHDFNNLLMAINGNLDLALYDIPLNSPARSSIEQSIGAVHRAANLTRQMLAYAGRTSFDVRNLDLTALVEENAHLFRACISRLVTFDLRLTHGLPPIIADAAQVQQVIMNLITNASEAIGDRAGVIVLATGAEDFDAARLSASRLAEIPPAGRFAFIEVDDTGCGMDADTLQHLFDPFFTTKFLGRGLGTASILGIVRAHHGAIFVDSAIGKGTRFRVLFPAEALTPPAEDGDAGDAATAKEPRGTILVVDDEESIRSVCERILSRDGWQVLVAEDGPRAIEAFRQQASAISCVLLDLSMPGMDGFDVLGRLREIDPAIRVILMSGFNNDAATDPRFTTEGRASFLKKPYSAKDLREMLEKILKPAR